jgi:tetratricopeptide (TPR) repeat protein
LAEVLAHEARFWRWQYPRRFPDDPLDRAEFVAGVQRVVAGVTLLGGLPSRDAVESLRARVRGPGLANLARFLHWLYPGRGAAGRPAAWVGGLEPDLLGEALVARVLADAETPQDYLERVFADGESAGLRNGFVVLGLMALWDEPHGTAWLARLLAADVPGRARAAFDAALTLGGHTALAPLGQVLAEALARGGTAETAAELEPLVPWETVSLREVGLWAVRTLVDRPPPSSEDEATNRERARLLHNAGKRLSDLGRREEALQAFQEAVEIRRRLAVQRPDAFLPALAASLTGLGVLLSALGRREEALQATAEAVRLTLPLVARYPRAFLDRLRSRLQNLRQRCAESGQDPGADPLVRQTTELLARLDAASGA